MQNGDKIKRKRKTGQGDGKSLKERQGRARQVQEGDREDEERGIILVRAEKQGRAGTNR